MEVHGKSFTKVDINPIYFLDNLKSKILGDVNNWVEKEEDKYYKCFEGYHSSYFKEEISKELYDIIEAIKIINSYLVKNKIS